MTEAEMAVESAAAAFGVDARQLFRRGKRQPQTLARQVAQMLLRDQFGWNYQRIAKLFCQKSHRSPWHAVHMLSEQLDLGDREITRRVQRSLWILAQLRKSREVAA